MVVSKNEYICGDFYENQCDVTFGGNAWGYSKNNAIDINLNLIDDACDTPYVYIDASRVSLLFSVLKITNYKKPFYLVTHNSDITFDSGIDIPNCIIKWYGQNINFINDRVKSIPIGLERDAWYPYKRDILETDFNVEKSKLLYFNCNVNTNIVKRSVALKTLSEKSFCEVKTNLEYNEYVRDLQSSFFVASPDGNGIDCHRTWEILYSGSVPILIDSNSHRMCYEKLPVLIIPNWDVITEEFLRSKISEYYDANNKIKVGDLLLNKNFLIKYENK